jgi:hypothetical protein
LSWRGRRVGRQCAHGGVRAPAGKTLCLHSIVSLHSFVRERKRERCSRGAAPTLLSSSSCFQHGKCLIKFQSEHTESYSFWSGFTLCVFVKEKTSLSSSIVWGFQLTIGLLHCLLLPAGYRYKHEAAVLGVSRYNIGTNDYWCYLYGYIFALLFS